MFYNAGMSMSHEPNPVALILFFQKHEIHNLKQKTTFISLTACMTCNISYYFSIQTIGPVYDIFYSIDNSYGIHILPLGFTLNVYRCSVKLNNVKL